MQLNQVMLIIFKYSDAFPHIFYKEYTSLLCVWFCDYKINILF